MIGVCATVSRGAIASDALAFQAGSLPLGDEQREPSTARPNLAASAEAVPGRHARLRHDRARLASDQVTRARVEDVNPRNPGCARWRQGVHFTVHDERGSEILGESRTEVGRAALPRQSVPSAATTWPTVSDGCDGRQIRPLLGPWRPSGAAASPTQKERLSPLSPYFKRVYRYRGDWI